MDIETPAAANRKYFSWHRSRLGRGRSACVLQLRITSAFVFLLLKGFACTLTDAQRVSEDVRITQPVNKTGLNIVDSVDEQKDHKGQWRRCSCLSVCRPLLEVRESHRRALFSLFFSLLRMSGSRLMRKAWMSDSELLGSFRPSPRKQLRLSPLHGQPPRSPLACRRSLFLFSA